MPIQNQFKPIPAIDLPFLNVWRDKIIETAWSLGIDTPVQRELIDFEELFHKIQEVSLIKRKQINQLDDNVAKLKKNKMGSLAEILIGLKNKLIGIN